MMRFLLPAAAGLATLMASTETNLPPTITLQPISQVVYEGQAALIEVVAEGTAPLRYQWTKDGTGISGGTAAIVSIPQATTNNSGAYQVIVTNLFGSVTSEIAQLTVRPITARKLRLAGYVEPAPGQVRIPVQLACLGNENQIEFTVSWNPEVVTYSGVTSPLNAGNTNVVGPVITNSTSTPVVPVLDTSRLAEGRVGITLSLPAGNYLLPATNLIAEVNFVLNEGAVPAAAALGLLEEPVATRVRDTNAVNLPVDNVILPVVRLSEGPGLIVNQSGLFWERLAVINPGNSNLPSAWISVTGLGLDSLSRQIRLQNLTATASVGPVLQLLDIPAGQTVNLIAEYYVSDRVTQPTPVYEAHVSWPVVPVIAESGRPKVERVLFRNNLALVEFNTISKRLYYVQYAPTADATNWTTSLPPLAGNGQRLQWIDNGPPKTESLPGNATNRFYRIIQSN
jgi:hypothetical protein